MSKYQRISDELDAWLPNYDDLGISHDDARTIVGLCLDAKDAGDKRDWTIILAEKSQEVLGSNE